MGAQAQSTEVRQAAAATKLEVKNGIEVVITQSDTLALKAEAASYEVLKKVVTKYSGNTLKIYLSNTEGLTNTGAIRVYLSQKNLPAIKAESGAAIKAAGKWHSSEADINLATGATFSGDLEVTGTCTVKAASGSGFRGIINTGTFNVTVLGGAYAKVMGTANLADIFCSSASVQAGRFICQKAGISAQNASAVCIQAKEFIKADTDPSSSITYYGEPERTQLGDNTYAIKKNTQKLNLN